WLVTARARAEGLGGREPHRRRPRERVRLSRDVTTSGSEGSHQLWGGRFSEGPAPEMVAVNRSIGVDFRLWPFDVQLSQAWASALAQAGVVTESEGRQMRDGLS